MEKEQFHFEVVPLSRALRTAITLFVAAFVIQTTADDWPRFRGAGGDGVSVDRSIPLHWGDGRNLAWRAALPGPGSSSPIVSRGRVFVTSYSGYGVDRDNSGRMKDLRRHLVCFDAATGREIWKQTIAAALPEDAYRGYIAEHGYASNTPVTDGERVYAFFGKSGAIAFDCETGRELWRANLGMESGNRRWGSAASPILFQDKLIVTASEESQSVCALDKVTGRELWKAEGSNLELVYSTPRVIDAGGRQDLVVAAVNEVWGLNPENGKLRWLAETGVPGNVCPGVVYADETIYTFGGFPRRVAAAIRVGGKGDVTDTHVRWTSGDSPYVPTPVFREGAFYWVDRSGIAQCIRASDGGSVYRERLQSGGERIQVYASPVIVGDRIIAVTRNAGVFVLAPGPEFRQLARNVFESDNSEFCGTPAVAGGRLFLRSNEALYCVKATTGASISPVTAPEGFN